MKPRRRLSLSAWWLLGGALAACSEGDDPGAPRDAATDLAERDNGLLPACRAAHFNAAGAACVGDGELPLPDTCCLWNCDLNLCDAPPGPCGPGLARAVSFLGCRGPCVPPESCRPLGCADAGQTCPSGWRCDPSAGLCRFGL